MSEFYELLYLDADEAVKPEDSGVESKVLEELAKDNANEEYVRNYVNEEVANNIVSPVWGFERNGYWIKTDII